MAKMTGLGRGLDALFASTVEEEKKEEQELQKNDENGIQQLKMIEIEPNRKQARKTFSEESIEDLSKSIKEFGLLQPIIVAKKDGFYQIIAGERRWRACKKLGLKEIPAIVKNDDEQRNMEISLIENVQREELNPIERAMGFKSLLDGYGLTQQELSERIGKPRSSISNSIRLLNLDQRVIDLALEGKLSEGHCKSILANQDKDKQYAMALSIIENGDSVHEAEKKAARNKTKRNIDRKYEPIYREIETTFRNFFGTKVNLNAKARSGQIVIKYNTNEELERILDLIKDKKD